MVEDKELKRGLSFPMAIFIIVGMVIGSSIWVSPAAYLSTTGPAIFIAYLLAVIPGIFVAFIVAYVGSALPVAGGSYVITSIMTAWLIILAVGGALAYLATTFGLFIGELFNIAPHDELIFSVIIAMIVLFAFYFLNWIKIELSGLVELIITIVGDILVMLIFIFAAIPHFNASNFDPLFPLGLEPMLFATLTFFYSYTGFTLILDVAGEVKKPSKNIPRSLVISIVLLVVLYTLQALMVASVQPYATAGDLDTVTKIILFGGILPPEALVVIRILIAVAIASTLHPIYMAYSRDILMAGRERLFPQVLSRVNAKHRTPRPALTLLLIVGIALLITFVPIISITLNLEVGTTATLMSVITGIIVLILQIPICLAAVILPKKFPKYHERSRFKPSRRVLKIMGILGAVFSFIFILLLFTEPEAGFIISVIVFPYAGVGIIIYLIRKKKLVKKGIDIKELMNKLPESVITDEGVLSKIDRLASDKDT
ncbi:MAG: APC family permease [Candidatus Lokiarchaeota archaeon]